MKRLLLAFALFWSSVAWGQVEVRRYNTLTELLSANPSGFSVAGRATVIVTGNTNLLDGTSRILAYSASDTGAVDNVTIFAPANTNFPGRYRLLKPGFGFSDLTNAIAGGTNVTLTYATGPDRIVVNSAATGSSFQFRVEDLPYTNINVVESSTIDPSVSLGTNLAFGIKNYSVTLPMLATINPESLMGFGQGSGPEEIRRVSLGSGLAWSGDTIVATGGGGFDFSALTNALIAGANITFDITTNTLTINATGGGGGTNGTAVTVDGGADLTRANFADSSEITFSISGTNVTAGIPNDSIALGTKTSGNFVAGVVGTANEVEVTGGSGSEASTATISLPATIDLGGKTSFEIPNGASPTTDAFGEIAGDNNAWASGRGAVQFFDGTANTYLIGVLASDTPVNGQVPMWNTGGTITWETATGSSGIDTTTNYTWTGTNTYLGPVYLDLLYVTNLLAESLQVPFTNALVYANGSSNLAAVTIGSGLSFSGGTLSATGGGGGTNGTVVTVDGGADQVRVNLADSSEVTFTLTGTNVTAGIPNDSIALGTKTTGNFVAGVVGTANEVEVSGGSGSEASTATLSLPATIDLGGKTSFEIPNGASPTTDAFGEIAGDNNAWASGRGAVQFFDGTANTYLIGVLASDTPSNGQVPVWNTGGTITWEDQTGGGGGGGSTSNVIQRTGFAEFTVTPGYAITNLVVSGALTNVSMTEGNGSLRGYFVASLSPARSGTNYSVVIEIEAEDPTALGSPVGNVVFDTKTTTGFDFVARFNGSEAVPAGTKYLVSVLEPVTVGASTNSGGGLTETWKYLTVDQATTNTTPQNITNMVFSIGANEVWTAEWFLGATVSGATGTGFAVDVPAGATLGATVRGSAAIPTVITADSTLSAAVLTSATGAIWGSALIQNGTNAGSVQLQFGSITNTVTSTIKGNQSYMVARKISP